MSCTILDSNDTSGCGCLLYAEEIKSCKWVLRKYNSCLFAGRFENHFRRTRETCELLSQEIMQTGRIPIGNSSGRSAIVFCLFIFFFLIFIARRIQVTLHCITVSQITYNHNSHSSLTLHYLHGGATSYLQYNTNITLLTIHYLQYGSWRKKKLHNYLH